MLDNKGNYKFYTKDDSNSMLYRRPLMKRNKQYVTNFKVNEIILRSRSTKNKNIPCHNFPLRHYFVCLNKCKKACKYENYKLRKIPTSIEGLNCDQIDDYLYASQRLTNRLIKEYDLVNKLKELNVGLIVNCQEKGEHPYCGTVYKDGLDENGFSYSTDELEKNGIHVLFCGWVDFAAPESFSHMIKIVKEMHYCIHGLHKKVLVHCHAGLGRTGSSLACYKIFSEKLNAENARKEIRKGTRKASLGEGKLYTYVQEFSKYLEISRENFFKKNKKDITIFKINEKLFDVGNNYKFIYFNDKKTIDNVPIFLLYIFDRIIEIKNSQKIDEKKMNFLLLSKDINDNKVEEIVENIMKEINNYNWESIKKIEDIKILTKLLFKWLNNSINYVINPKEISMVNFDDYLADSDKLKDQTKEVLKCIKLFLDLVKDSKSEGNENIKDFLEIFVPCLLGYTSRDNNKLMEENISKINKYFNLVNKGK